MIRAVSPTERLWLAADHIASPFANQYVIEGRGAVSLGALRSAVEAAASQAPGLAMRCRGAFSGLRWEAGPPPRVLEAEWDGYADAPFLRGSLPGSGPVAEVVLAAPRIVFRTAHAVTDGRGTDRFARAVFSVLRGEPAPALQPGPSDLDLARRLEGRREPPVGDDAPPPLTDAERAAVTAPPTFAAPVWMRRTAMARPRDVLARALDVIADSVPPAFRDGVRLDVSVDLRRHEPGCASTANLAGIIRLRGSPPAARLDEALAARDELGFVLGAAGLPALPPRWLAAFGRASARKAQRSLRFSATATVSNLGRVDVAALSCPGFDADGAFFIPPGSPGLPLFVALTGTASRLDVVGTMPARLAATGALARLLDTIAAACTSA